MANNSRTKHIRITICIAAAGLAGFALSQLLAANAGESKLAELLAEQIRASTYGPIIAVGLAAAASVFCAVAIPVIVVITLNTLNETKGKHQ